MDSTQKHISDKPLNCLYCRQAVLSPGSSRTANIESIPPTPNCFSYDVPHELFDLFILRGGNLGSMHDYTNIYNWLPYHCGHFLPRIVQLRCAVCLKPGKFEEWRMVQAVFIDKFNIMVCNDACKQIYFKGGNYEE